jgi:hypothetical protein
VANAVNLLCGPLLWPHPRRLDASLACVHSSCGRVALGREHAPFLSSSQAGSHQQRNNGDSIDYRNWLCGSDVVEPRRSIPRRVASAAIVGMVRTLGDYGRSGTGKVRTKASGSRSMHYERAPRFRRSKMDVSPPPLRLCRRMLYLVKPRVCTHDGGSERHGLLSSVQKPNR